MRWVAGSFWGRSLWHGGRWGEETSYDVTTNTGPIREMGPTGGNILGLLGVWGVGVSVWRR